MYIVFYSLYYILDADVNIFTVNTDDADDSLHIFTLSNFKQKNRKIKV